MVGMRVHRTFVARLLANIKDAHILVIEKHFVMLRVDFRGVLRFRHDHGQDRHDDNWNEFFHNYNLLLVWKARRSSSAFVFAESYLHQRPESKRRRKAALPSLFPMPTEAQVTRSHANTKASAHDGTELRPPGYTPARVIAP